MKSLYQATMMFVVMTVCCGILYPLIINGLAQTLFPHKANGSIVTKDGVIIGSELIAQDFKHAHYFWPRPSAYDFRTLPSRASNLGPTSSALKKQIAERRAHFAAAHGINESDVPIDMITASASGLDPHISWESAQHQAKRVARARGFTDAEQDKLMDLIDQRAEKIKLAKFGEKMLNVLMLNINLDRLSHHDGQ